MAKQSPKHCCLTGVALDTAAVVRDLEDVLRPTGGLTDVIPPEMKVVSVRLYVYANTKAIKTNSDIEIATRKIKFLADCVFCLYSDNDYL